MSSETITYQSVVKAFESLGYNVDSCLSEYEYLSALDKLVKRNYPQSRFDE